MYYVRTSRDKHFFNSSTFSSILQTNLLLGSVRRKSVEVIVCDNFTGHVHQIRLCGVDGHCYPSYYNTDEEDEGVLKEMLGGDLSPSLLQLQQLVHLDLSCNDFEGIQVPSFMGSLKNLRYLNLSSSKFGGIIPPQLGNLSKLHVLCLGSFSYGSESTSMLNMQWLSSLGLLRHLDMSRVNLYKAVDWFQVINTLPSLAELHLSYCQLSNAHSHVSSLNITSLSLLDLSHNWRFDDSFVPRWIFGTTSLVSLDLSGCGFLGRPNSSIDSFQNLTSLKLLHVSENEFMNSSSVLKGLSGSSLVSLDISHCGVSSSQLVALHNLTSLVSLDLSYNQLTKPIPKLLGNLCKPSSLESLILRGIRPYLHLTGQLGQLQLIHLVHLDLSYNYIVGSLPEWIRGLSSLEMLDLSFNRLNGSSLPASLSHLPKLGQLDLSYNQLDGNFPDCLCNLSKLYRLDLSYNQLNGNLPDCLSHLSKLDRLDLSNNQLNGGLPHTLCHLSKLYRLELSGNRFNGSLPGCLGRLSKLKFLRLSNNQLNGNLPHIDGQLSELYYLDLSNNLLTGVVTEARGNPIRKLRSEDQLVACSI